MSDDESVLERPQEEAQQLGEHDPRRGYWGSYVYDDGPGFAGGGMGIFRWFANRAKAISYVRCHLVAVFSGDGEVADWRSKQAVCDTFFSRLGAYSELGVDELRELNPLFKGVLQIPWFGPFSELVESETAFARDLRSWFRENGDDPQDATDEQLAAPLKRRELVPFRFRISEGLPWHLVKTG